MNPPAHARGRASTTASPPPPPGPPPPGPVPPGSPPSGLGLARRRLGRSPHDRVVSGVAGGLARRLGVDAALVRIAFVVLAFAGGTGIVLYGLAWALLPVDPRDAPPSRPASMQQAVALGLILLGVLLLLRGIGLWFGDAVVLPVLLAAAGSAVVWLRADGDERASLARLRRHVPDGAVASAAAGPVSPARVVVGTLLVAGGIAGFLAAHDALAALRELGLAVLAAAAGVALLFGPWLWRLVDELGTERRERIRQEERAELAAHLHDSVLQTLALIQRSADHPRRMVTLARRQERELRNWLYGPSRRPTSTSLADACETLAGEVESDHDVGVEVVVVGEAPADDRADTLLAAVREAVVNAAKHAGVPTVDVYVEVEPDQIVAFVRDRGRGFDPDAVSADRQGIRRSIVGRVERHGGRARITSTPEGTEVEVRVPRRRIPRPEEAPSSGSASADDREVEP